ncbi:MAG: hypothetical protein ACTSRU_04810 [Candidatus Hodarchaeales archaeon]
METKKSERVEEHCGSCGSFEEATGMECTCPCHTWEGRICQWCGGIVELLEYQVGVKLNLKGDVIPHLKVKKSRCKECGR